MSENEGLHELLGVASLVGRLANDLDDNVVERSLGVYVGNANFAVLEIEFLDAILDVLWEY